MKRQPFHLQSWTRAREDESEIKAWIEEEKTNSEKIERTNRKIEEIRDCIKNERNKARKMRKQEVLDRAERGRKRKLEGAQSVR